MEKVVLTEEDAKQPVDKQAEVKGAPAKAAVSDYADRSWEKRFRRRRKFAQAESYLSSNSFIIIFLFIYVNANLLMYTWGAHDEFKHQKGHARTWAIVIARGFGYTLNLNCALVIILACRLSFTLLRETSLNLVLPFDKSFPAFHIIVGYSILAAVIGHGVFHMIWIIVWNGWGPGLWGVTWVRCSSSSHFRLVMNIICLTWSSLRIS